MNEQKAKHLRLTALLAANRAYEQEGTVVKFREYIHHQGTVKMAQRFVLTPIEKTEQPPLASNEYFKWTAKRQEPIYNEDGSPQLEEYVLHPGRTTLHPLCIKAVYKSMKKIAKRVEQPTPTKRQVAAAKLAKKLEKKHARNRAKVAARRRQTAGWSVAA